MITTTLPDSIARQQWLEPVAKTLQGWLHRAFQSGGEGGQRAKNFLHGTWLGHPVHVIFTDIPLGAWTAAVAFDFLEATGGRRRFGTVADAAVTVGLLGATGAAITGLTDFQDVDPPASRIGLVHGLLNIAGASLFLTSLIQRRKHARAAGRRFALAGYVVALSSAFLGGALVYDEGIGVDHTLGQSFPEDFTAVLAQSELSDGEMKRAEYRGVPILLARRGERIFALAETCTHLGGPLSEGKLTGDTVQCPWHGSRFSLHNGRVLDGPAVHPQPCLEARVRDGQIEVRMPGAKPGMAGTTGATIPRPEAA